jgi:hypothetical protein
MFLRSFGDDLKRLLLAYEREQRAGREHPNWLACAGNSPTGFRHNNSRMDRFPARGIRTRDRSTTGQGRGAT